MDVGGIQIIDFSAIESELATAIGSTGYTSTETGRIRQEVPTSQMPSLDISAQGHSATWIGGYIAYRLPVIIVIRRLGWDRKDNADAFKLLVEGVCTTLETYAWTAIDAVREVSSEMGEEAAGNGQLVRTVIINFVCLAHG